MIPLIVGLVLLIVTFLNLRDEDADPLLFSDFLSNHFEITREEHPFIYWATITVQILVGLGAISYGLVSLSG